MYVCSTSGFSLARRARRRPPLSFGARGPRAARRTRARAGTASPSSPLRLPAHHNAHLSHTPSALPNLPIHLPNFFINMVATKSAAVPKAKAAHPTFVDMIKVRRSRLTPVTSRWGGLSTINTSLRQPPSLHVTLAGAIPRCHLGHTPDQVSSRPLSSGGRGELEREDACVGRRGVAPPGPVVESSDCSSLHHLPSSPP